MNRLEKSRNLFIATLLMWNLSFALTVLPAWSFKVMPVLQFSHQQQHLNNYGFKQTKSNM